MFGYVNVNKSDLKVSELEDYGAFYCGLCKALKNGFGGKGRLCVNYDMTFLSILLADLYDCPLTNEDQRCMVHPGKRKTISHKYQEYCADMTMYLSYLKCMDDWVDDRKVSRLAYAKAVKKDVKEIYKKYPAKCKAIKGFIKELSQLEKEDCDSIDQVATVFGRLMSEVFYVVDDNFSNILRNLGFYMGKFVYVLDTYLDYDSDKKRGNYNPLHHLENNEDLRGQVEAMLTDLIALAARNYELLPLDQYVPILSNIIYSGIWNDFRRTGKKENK